MTTRKVRIGATAEDRGHDQAVAVTEEPVKKVGSSASEGDDDLTTAGRQNLEAYLKASSIAAAGLEELGRAWLAFAKHSADANLTATRALLGCRTVSEVVGVQAEWTKTSVDGLLAEGAKLSGMSVELAGAALAPLNARMNQVASIIVRATTA